MTRRHSLRRATTAGALLAAATLGFAPVTASNAAVRQAATSTATGAIGPGESFVGTVNHRTGQQQAAPVRVACAGPVRPNQTTHPLAHQPLEVVRAANSNTNAGSTGPHGTRITAYLGIPPAAGAGTTSQAAATAAGTLPTFTHYGVTQPLPTSITVPCAGRGYITFMPWPRDPGQSRAFVVPVEYVNIAV